MQHSTIDTPDTSALIGIPFVLRGRDPKQGLDCLGLALHALQLLRNVQPPDIPADYGDQWADDDMIGEYLDHFADQWTQIDPVRTQPGDICTMCFRHPYADHLGVCIDDTTLVLTTFEKTGSLLMPRTALPISGWYRFEPQSSKRVSQSGGS
jgi:cell wall-associated NlpC family hydrolase|tara:strand:- start:624 stop:1079 length:456 start_codon:yes stop_codon:yes gene_type:complete